MLSRRSRQLILTPFCGWTNSCLVGPREGFKSISQIIWNARYAVWSKPDRGHPFCGRKNSCTGGVVVSPELAPLFAFLLFAFLLFGIGPFVFHSSGKKGKTAVRFFQPRLVPVRFVFFSPSAGLKKDRAQSAPRRQSREADPETGMCRFCV